MKNKCEDIDLRYSCMVLSSSGITRLRAWAIEPLFKLELLGRRVSDPWVISRGIVRVWWSVGGTIVNYLIGFTEESPFINYSNNAKSYFSFLEFLQHSMNFVCNEICCGNWGNRCEVLILITWGPNINQNALATPKTVPISFYGKLSEIIPGREVNYFCLWG